MGYYASGYGTITIRADYDTPTLQKLYKSKTLDFRDGSKELQAETFLDLILDHDPTMPPSRPSFRIMLWPVRDIFHSKQFSGGHPPRYVKVQNMIVFKA